MTINLIIDLRRAEMCMFTRDDLYNAEAFKIHNFRYVDDPFDTIVSAYAVLISDASPIRKKAALLILRALVRQEFLDCLLSDDVAPFSRDDVRVAAWAKAVKKSKCCEICGATKDLEAHHILSWAEYPSGRIDVQNGMCLCVNCHARVHKGERAEKLILSKAKRDSKEV